MNKVPATYTITKSVLVEFNRNKGCYNKSALIESFMIEFLERVKKGNFNPQSPSQEANKNQGIGVLLE